MSTKLKEEAFASKFDSWWPKIRPFFISGGLDPIFERLKADTAMGKKITPDSKVTFRCFRETPISTLKVVLIGMCPYHSTVGGKMVADGLLMGCENTNKAQPSLVKFYEGVEKDAYNGISLTSWHSPSVLYLAQQGVLMFNSALTTEIGTAGVHQELWEPFTKFIIKEIIGLTGVPIVGLGKEASSYLDCLPDGYPKFSLYHPVYASYKQIPWDTKGVFTEINNILVGTNGVTPIEWLAHRLHEIDDLPF